MLEKFVREFSHTIDLAVHRNQSVSSGHALGGYLRHVPQGEGKGLWLTQTKNRKTEERDYHATDQRHGIGANLFFKMTDQDSEACSELLVIHFLSDLVSEVQRRETRRRTGEGSVKCERVLSCHHSRLNPNDKASERNKGAE